MITQIYEDKHASRLMENGVSNGDDALMTTKKMTIQTYVSAIACVGFLGKPGVGARKYKVAGQRIVSTIKEKNRNVLHDKDEVMGRWFKCI